MSVYLKSLTREREILTNEVDRIVDGFSKENNDESGNEDGFIAFKRYHDLRVKRFELEAEQSNYFLFKQLVEDNCKKKEEEEIIAPTLTRTLGEDFSLQQ
jgi:hypothetical protein